ncbi:MAG: DUF2332 domain-containing protein, partial [Cytophagales bacterium]|nr:DUF2332 domain-containing protein [Rhizobacter sp.]
YEALCRIVAADPALLDLLSGTPDEQRRPNLWLAAVHERILAGAARPLAAYFPSAGGTRAPDEALAACVKDFAAANEAALRERMRTQTTQTNEIGRCAVLWPALHAIVRRSGKSRLALLDLGCSAGLNLNVDAYRYDYAGDLQGAAAQPGVPLVPCRPVGSLRPAFEADMRIVQRCGIDPAPVDVNDTETVGWLRACLWPADSTRATRFTQAVALARARRWPVLRVADCTAYVSQWLASVPSDVQPVVFNSWVLTYFERAALARHINNMTGLVQSTGAMWLSAESPALRIGPLEATPAGGETRTGTWWTLCSRKRGDKLRFEVLANSHPHGRWMEWLDTTAG